jgi:MFS family permease
MAGIIVVLVGAAGCFLINALSYVAMLYALGRIHVTSRHRANDRAPFFKRTAEGLSYLRAHRTMLRLILIMGCISLLGLPYFFFLPGFAQNVLHVDARKLGYLTAAVSVGGLIGGLTMRAIADRFDKHSIVTCAGGLFWAFLIAFSLSRNYLLSVLLLTGLGFVLVLTISTVNNLLQISTPSEMRGRVMSVNGIAVNGLAPIGSLLAGAVAQQSSLPFAIKLLALTGLVVTTALMIAVRSDESVAVLPTPQGA